VFARTRYRFGASESSGHIARFGFSISCSSAFASGLGRGTSPAERENVLDLRGGRLSRTLQVMADFFNAGPGSLRHVLQNQAAYPERRGLSAVRHASSGGDLVPVEVLDGIQRRFRQSRVFSITGGTELVHGMPLYA